MKTIITKSYLSQYILICLGVALSLIGFLFSEYEISFWPAAFAYIEHQGKEHPVLLGVVPLANFTYFIGFMFLYLHYEFYGLKNSIYSIIGLCLTLLALYGSLEIFHLVQFKNADSMSVINFKELITFSLKDVISIVIALFGGYLTIFFLAATLRKLTANYFMFVRYTLAGCVGFGVFVVLRLYLIRTQNWSLEHFVLNGVTPYSQFVVGLIFSLVPLYLLRLIFGFFAGKKIEETTPTKKIKKESKKETSLFRAPPATESSDIIIETQTETKKSTTVQTQSDSQLEPSGSEIISTQTNFTPEKNITINEAIIDQPILPPLEKTESSSEEQPTPSTETEKNNNL